MLKKIFLAIFISLLSIGSSYSASVVNVEYVHNLIKNVWDIDVPYNESSLKYVANMEYLLKAVDKANEILNGVQISNFGEDVKYATKYAADTVVTKEAVDTLITKMEMPFTITTTSDTSSFSFSIAAEGTFYVDWGDGSGIKKIEKTNTSYNTYTYEYETPGKYEIKLGGKATGYSDAVIDVESGIVPYDAISINFMGNSNIASISGSLGKIFGSLPDGTSPRFAFTFAQTPIKTVPSELFSDIDGKPSDYMFIQTFSGCTGLSSIPSDLFADIKGAPTKGIFYSTFSECTGLKGNIPSGLFAGISGAPADYMFAGTFYNCGGLTSIPSNLFAGISGAPASNMFNSTFSDCFGLTGISSGLFAGINGAPAENMYRYTFSGCNKLTGNIPTGFFGKFSGAPAENMFSYTFYGCSGLTGNIPENLFAGISGAPAKNMFLATFRDCSGLTGEIPANLFAGISGAPAETMFSMVFYNCSGLTGEIPSGLFAGISGEPQNYMFNQVFHGCSGLTGEIPAGLFGNISGAPAENMYRFAFSGCNKLTGEIPAGLFGDLSGAPANNMFASTFSGCTGLTGEIPIGLFGDLSGALATSMFNSTFKGCTGLTGESARMPDGQYLYDYFNTATSSNVSGMYTNCTGLTDYSYIPTVWGGLGETRPEMPFSITTTPDTSSFDFSIGASGTFYVDWGDGSEIEKIEKTDLNVTKYSHTYSNAGEYEIKLGGKATGYNNVSIDAETSSGVMESISISFMGNSNIASISGSLGEIFSPLSDGTSPRFVFAFAGCTGLTSIPADLFSGISGAPADYMFYGTFTDCINLKEIPSALFAGISGAPADGMFASTFAGCSGLTGEIPVGLFGDLSGAPADYMFTGTFGGCSGLTGEIPVGLFGDLSGAPAEYMFHNTFSGCTGLTGESARMPDGQYLYDYFDTATFSEVGNMYTNCTGLKDYSYIPTVWGGLGETRPEMPFSITTTPNASRFDFSIGAAGTFYVDWGDGSKIEKIEKTDLNVTIYSHTYSNAGEYEIKLGGKATDYITSGSDSTATTTTISFYYNKDIASISGSLGKIFGNLPDGRSPRFENTFYNCTSLTSIPADLFSGISGTPADYMFYNTFSGCIGLTSIPENLFAGISGAPAKYMFANTFHNCFGLTSIPAGLFGDLSGAPAEYMFYNTFRYCSDLTGEIPIGLFGDLSGAPAEGMFYGTFEYCSGLTGEIPAGLFGDLSGAPASNMFDSTFSSCSGLTGEIPIGLFGDLSGAPASWMFSYTFYGCSGLTGESARMPDGQYLYDYFNTATSNNVSGMYKNCTGLTDYSSIPSAWK